MAGVTTSATPDARWTVRGRPIGTGHPAYVIAELSGNHLGSQGRAVALVRAAAKAGADAVKFQHYVVEDMVPPDSDHPAYRMTAGRWAGQRLQDLYARCQTPAAWIGPLAEAAHAEGLAAICSVFSPAALDRLPLDALDALKVATAEEDDYLLWVALCERAPETVVFTSSTDPFRSSLRHPRAFPLFCVPTYPTPAAARDFAGLRALAQQWPAGCGYSDHSGDMDVPGYAVAAGASVVEVHLMLDDDASLAAEDAAFSLDPEEFGAMVRGVRRVDGMAGAAPTDLPQFQRRLAATRDLGAGHVIRADDIRTVRANIGLPVSWYFEAIGQRTSTALRAGDPLLGTVP